MPKKILVVDDEPGLTEPLREILEDEGYDIVVVHTGKRALEEYELSVKDKKLFDLILLDIILPRMSGLEVLNTIRASEKTRQVKGDARIPVIMLSGLKESWMDDAYEDGCNDYIIKPYDVDDLLAKIKEMLSKRRG